MKSHWMMCPWLAALLFAVNFCFAETPKDAPTPVAASEKANADHDVDADPSAYIDDEKFMDDFTAKLTELAKQKKCLSAVEIEAKLGKKECALSLPPPGTKVLSPEEVYERALQSVFVVGSVEMSLDEGEKWDGGRISTAWALTTDGVMVTNRHVFEDLGNECFAIANHKGEVFPVTDILAASEQSDLVVFRVAGKGFVPLPLSRDEKVGAWIGVLSHPGNQLFSFTQGFITRYTRTLLDGKAERWMSITADFAGGSSGAPVLNKFGAVVGVATFTENIDYDENEFTLPAPVAEADRKASKPERATDPKELQPIKPSSLQMIVKTTIPSRAIFEMVGKK